MGNGEENGEKKGKGQKKISREKGKDVGIELLHAYTESLVVLTDTSNDYRVYMLYDSL